MYASIHYIQTKHPYGEIPGQPSQAPTGDPPPSASTALPNGPANPQQGQKEAEEPPDEPHVFDAALRELARDLVLKEQQIELLIHSLPGLGNSEADQVKRMRELEKELREVEAERAKAETEREALVDGLGKVLVGVKRAV
jgi:mediator of RNA polymerase II transcription subunit 21